MLTAVIKQERFVAARLHLVESSSTSFIVCTMSNRSKSKKSHPPSDNVDRHWEQFYYRRNRGVKRCLSDNSPAKSVNARYDSVLV